MFEYIICTVANEEIFSKQCTALEKNLPDLKKGKLLVDVDGSKIQEYFLGQKLLTVCNSIDLNDVHIRCEFDLEKYF